MNIPFFYALASRIFFLNLALADLLSFFSSTGSAGAAATGAVKRARARGGAAGAGRGGAAGGAAGAAGRCCCCCRLFIRVDVSKTPGCTAGRGAAGRG